MPKKDLKEQLKNIDMPSTREIENKAKHSSSYKKEIEEKDLVLAEKELEENMKTTLGLNDMYQLRKNNRLFVQVIFFLSMAVVTLVSAFPLILPLKEKEHHFIVMETENGVKVANVVEPYNLPINLRSDLADFYIRDTVRRFAEFSNYQKDVKNFQVIRARVTPEALQKMKKLRDKFAEENENVRRQITINNSKQIDRSTIRVFFTAHDQNDDFQETTFDMVADVNFYLNHEKAGSSTVLFQERSERLLNPLGLQIYDYNILKGDFDE